MKPLQSKSNALRMATLGLIMFVMLFASAADADSGQSPADSRIEPEVRLLRSGLNLLAIHGLNTSKADSDFLISVELVAHGVSQGDVAPSATSSIQRR